MVAQVFKGTVSTNNRHGTAGWSAGLAPGLCVVFIACMAQPVCAFNFDDLENVEKVELKERREREARAAAQRAEEARREEEARRQAAANAANQGGGGERGSPNHGYPSTPSASQVCLVLSLTSRSAVARGSLVATSMELVLVPFTRGLMADWVDSMDIRS